MQELFFGCQVSTCVHYVSRGVKMYLPSVTVYVGRLIELVECIRIIELEHLYNSHENTSIRDLQQRCIELT